MIQLKNNVININLCFHIEEWAKEFYDIPDGAIIDNREEMESECMGFAEPKTKTIWIFIPKNHGKWDLETTIAHEIGHIITHPKSPNPEEQAEHYEYYYGIVRRSIGLIRQTIG